MSVSVSGSFMTHYDELSDRLAHAATLFSTAVAFQMGVSSCLPQFEYMTLIDNYIVQLCGYILAAMTTMVGVSYLSSREVCEEEEVEVFA